VVSNFIVALGLSTLEIAANPFIALCGPPEHAEARLNFAQGIQAVGSVISPLLATLVLFRNLLDAPSLVNTQWTYLSIALFVAFLAVLFYYYPLPEASAKDLEDMLAARPSVEGVKLLGLTVPTITIALGTFAQFCYVGSQETVSIVFKTLVLQFKPE